MDFNKFCSLLILSTFLLTVNAKLEFAPFTSGDPAWPRQCVVPNCDVVARHLRYPHTNAWQFFQCRSVSGIWVSDLVPCPCDQRFDYLAQVCMRFDNPARFEWCLNSIDSSWISCGGEPTTTTPSVTTTTGFDTTTNGFDTTTTGFDTTTTVDGEVTPTTPPPGTTVWTPPDTPPGDTTTTDRYSTVTWG